MERVFVTGMGVRTPLGSDPEQLWARLLQGESSSSEWPDLVAEGFPVPRACRIEDDLGEPDPARRGRALARLAAGAALEHAAFAPGGRVGVYVGTTMGESRVFEDAGEGTELDLAAAAGNVFAAEVAAAFALDGPQRTYGTACAAGNYAIGAAAAAVRSGAVDVALAGGVEPFSRLALLGFARSRAMSSDFCRPFDRGRTGMQLGEAAAFLVLERGGRVEPLAAVADLGLSGDAFHPTAPRQDGSGMAAAMKACLGPRRDVGWVCAHGTATARSDEAEARALHTVFGDRPPPVSSLKGALGHSLGAATAVQAVVSVLALRERMLPPNANLVDLDHSLGLDVVAEPRPAAGLECVLSCGYAFGGLNSALLLEAA